MRVIAALVADIARALALDLGATRARVAIRVEQLVALGITALAVALAVGYQVLRRLPRSWRDALLGDETVEE